MLVLYSCIGPAPALLLWSFEIPTNAPCFRIVMRIEDVHTGACCVHGLVHAAVCSYAR